MQKFFERLFVLMLVLASQVAGAEQQDYVLGAGDMVRVTVYGSPDLTTETRVSSAGVITFPLLGEVRVGGSSAAVAEKKIGELLESGGFVKQPQVNLTVLQFQSQMVSVLGDVNKPGRYPLDRPTLLTDVLAMAGGPNVNGSEIVTVISQLGGEKAKREYDLRELTSAGGRGQNPKVMSDDIVYINAREVSVLGQVNRPGMYSIVGGVRSVMDFLSQAGGVSAGGADTIIVQTVRDGKPVKHEIDVDQLFKKGGDAKINFELMAGDSIYVPRFPMFYIYGEVQRPGNYRLERNMTVVQALSMGGGLTQRGTERGLRIKRRDANGQLQTIDAKIGDLLQADDVVYIRESIF